MRPTIQWIFLPAALVATPCAMYAVQYLTVAAAQQAIFPGAKLTPAELRLTDAQRKAIEKSSGVKVRVPEVKIWRVGSGGWLIVDEVIGKHEFITYAVGINEDGSVKQIEVMDYRENYGGEVREEKWRQQFIGKNHGSKLKLDDDIKNISGGTLSCRHITEGVKRLLALYELVLSK